MKTARKLEWYFRRISLWAYERYGETVDTSELAFCKDKVINDVATLKIQVADENIREVVRAPENSLFDYLGIIGNISNKFYLL